MLKYIELKNKIIDLLESYKPDEQIPTNSELAEKYSVSDITVRKAVLELEKEGLIYGIHRRGKYKAEVGKEYKEIVFLIDEVHVERTPGLDVNPGLLEAFQKDLTTSDYNLNLTLNSQDPEKEAFHIRKLLDRNIYGVIINMYPTRKNFGLYKRLCKKKSNVVFVDKFVPIANAHYVGTENYKGALLLMEEAKKEEYDKIIILSFAENMILNSEEDRLRAFNEMLPTLKCKDVTYISDWDKGLEIFQNLKGKKVCFLVTAGVVFNKIYDLYKEYIDNIGFCYVFSFDIPLPNIKKNMSFVWYKQNAKEIAHKAIELISKNPKKKKFIEIPGEIVKENYK